MAALKNSERKKIKLIATKESLKVLKKVDIPVEVVRSVQEEGEKLFKRAGFTFSRVPQNLILVTEPTIVLTPGELNIGKNVKMVALDGVTDIHNAAAILRTAAFYGVNYLIISQKNSFSITPSFARASSGGLEFVKIVRTSNLAKTIRFLNEHGVMTVGFSESGGESVPRKADSMCLVLGSEDNGISFAVNRNLSNHFTLKSRGNISTLNVSVAAAIAMQLHF